MILLIPLVILLLPNSRIFTTFARLHIDTLLRNLAAFYVDLLLLGVHSLNSDEREAISESQNGKQSSTLSKRLQ